MDASFTISDRKAWIAEHRSYIGGSGISAAAGLNKYKTKLALYLFMKGEIEDDAGIKARMGTCLEPLLRELFWEETGLRVIPCPMVRHPEYNFIGANPDGSIEDEPTSGFEGKTYDFSTEDAWGEPGTDQIPPEYAMQCQLYMGIKEWKKMYVEALHRTTGKSSVYVVRFNSEIYDMLIECGVRFHNNHLLPGIPPAPEAGDLEYIREIYPTETGETIASVGEVDEWAFEYLRLKNVIDPMEKERDGYKAKMMLYMESASMLTTMHGDFTYRQAKDKVTVEWQAVAKAMDSGMSYESAVAGFTTTKPGSRSFLFKKGTI